MIDSSSLKNDFLNAAHVLWGRVIVCMPGSVFYPGGWNGPYHHLEEVTRNTSHLLMIALKCSLIDDEKFRQLWRDRSCCLMQSILDFSLKINGVYVMRQKKGMDSCNGVIGPAWIIEAMAFFLKVSKTWAGQTKINSDVKQALEQQLQQMIFIDSVGVWKRSDPWNGLMSIDYTYNHQAWLACAIADANQVLNKAQDHVINFLNHSLSGFRTRPSGLIHHVLHAKTFKSQWNLLRYRISEKRHLKKVYLKEVGYHLFDLFALVRLKEHFPEHQFFNSNAWLKSLQYINEKFLSEIEYSNYSYTYNAPGFELPVIYKKECKMIPLDATQVGAVYAKQKQLTYDQQSGMFGINTPDPLTFSVRVYELGFLFENGI